MWRTTFEVKEEMSIFLRSTLLRKSLASNAQSRHFSLLACRSNTNQNQCCLVKSTPLRSQLCSIDKSLLTNHTNTLSSGSYRYSKVFWNFLKWYYRSIATSLFLFYAIIKRQMMATLKKKSALVNGSSRCLKIIGMSWYLCTLQHQPYGLVVSM